MGLKEGEHWREREEEHQGGIKGGFCRAGQPIVKALAFTVEKMESH